MLFRSRLKPVKLAVVGDELVKGPGRVTVCGFTAKKLIKMVPSTTITTRKMRKVALA